MAQVPPRRCGRPSRRSWTPRAPAAGKAIGFANPALYDAAGSAYSSDFHDITSGNNDYTPDGYTGGLYPAGTGYDMASGLGTPNGGPLAGTLCERRIPPTR